MKQIVTILEPNKITVHAGIMPLDSKQWNTGLDDKDKFGQIPLTLTFDLKGVVGNNEITEVCPLVERALDGYFIDARQALKTEANVDMVGKTNREKYDRMVELVSEWEQRVFELPIRTGREPGKIALQKKQVRELIQQTHDVMDMFGRFMDKVKSSTLQEIIKKAQQIPESDWIAQKGFIEAELINNSKK